MYWLWCQIQQGGIPQGSHLLNLPWKGLAVVGLPGLDCRVLPLHILLFMWRSWTETFTANWETERSHFVQYLCRLLHSLQRFGYRSQQAVLSPNSSQANWTSLSNEALLSVEISDSVRTRAAELELAYVKQHRRRCLHSVHKQVPLF